VLRRPKPLGRTFAASFGGHQFRVWLDTDTAKVETVELDHEHTSPN
jgi:hypothetical protein